MGRGSVVSIVRNIVVYGVRIRHTRAERQEQNSCGLFVQGKILRLSLVNLLAFVCGACIFLRRRSGRVKLVIDSVGKQYRGNLWGLRDLRLELGPGVLGLLGPNGAGKSTLMRILATVTRPTEGRVLWNDGDIARSPDPLRQVLGYLPQDFGVYPHLTALEFLEYLAAVKGLDGAGARRRIDELLAVVNLSEARNRPLGGFSGGMKQRVGIAQALLNDPQLL